MAAVRDDSGKSHIGVKLVFADLTNELFADEIIHFYFKIKPC
jgi:hypothetical protein